ncbi:hypothetical protein B0J11DRAFT_206431 [Dendryphion nanum]|uniref:Uncharacterized protein n=1 Tax=Dendryphion nanum TaxID=256645 RepID=A0A9P9D0Q6_9PLEO|nr:hypothetical protein B0J11DRAFT_206431 [Dendryphion nanum]
MATLEDKIQQASARNSEILAEIHEIDSSPSQLYQQLNYIRDLDSQITKSEKTVADKDWRTRVERVGYKKYSESTFNRLLHKASGRSDRFAEKAAKEEREYFDAVQAKQTAEDDLAYARQLRAEAIIQREKFERDSQRKDLLQSELDAMYNSIFSGPTPGLPDEDAKEQAVNDAQHITTQVSQAFEAQKHVLFLMDQVAAKLEETRQNLVEAHNYSSLDMFGVADTYSAHKKRNFLEKAESSISSVRMLQEQIRAINPNVAELGNVNIASGSIWGDVVFDNLFSDMNMHEKIKESEEELKKAIAKQKENRKLADQRAAEVEKSFREQSEMLRARRSELQSAREEAFRRVGGGERLPQGEAGAYQGSANPLQWGGVQSQGQVVQEPPPAYSA